MNQGAPRTSRFPRLILSGHAKLPQDAVARAVWEILSVVVAVDLENGTVLDADATLVTDPAKDFLRDLLVGRSLAEPPDQAIEFVQEYYWGGAKRALVAAIRELYENWAEWHGGGLDRRGGAIKS